MEAMTLELASEVETEKLGQVWQTFFSQER